MGEIKLNKNFFLYDEKKLDDNRIEIWLNKKIIDKQAKTIIVKNISHKVKKSIAIKYTQ